jgi:hypothetical protein
VRRSRLLEVAILILTFAVTLTLRVRGISDHFWLLEDQVRDWSIALRPFRALPLVGPPTHVHGYTIGPAFYWILWALRVSIGPWYHNLPHAGGIGQAMLQSAADTLLLVAVWRRTDSVWIGLATITLVATASFDLALSALVWNPVMGSTLSKTAIALVFLDWHRRSAIRVALTAAAAWAAVHAYTGTVFVTLGVFAAMVLDPLVRRDRTAAVRNVMTIAFVVTALQMPYVIHQINNKFRDSAMAVVSFDLGAITSGSRAPEWTKSETGYVSAVDYIQIAPWHFPRTGWILLAFGGIVAIRYRRDPVILTTVLLPQIAAIIGYALFLGALDVYYYLSLMPSAVLTVLLAATAVPISSLSRSIGVVACVGALAIVPGRLRQAAPMFKMPEYRVLVDASRKIASLGQPMRAVRLAFTLPPRNDPEFLYLVLGGRIDPQSSWIAIIASDGTVTYQKV